MPVVGRLEELRDMVEEEIERCDGRSEMIWGLVCEAVEKRWRVIERGFEELGKRLDCQAE